ncbi:Hydrogenase expression/formation protein like [Actinidia chinensis var. chinensis]|uniref:Hydrogenase expression/formation protein like n=1 Tax=Actinidia chinensis var. chinensis TaxID=1590841 RepID=A0A2R6QD90_ACTCC|nr:Hydrogenase expression/formation protein like [Actinidia chinensis var. chinensis]
MEGVGPRLGRASSRYGPSTGFSGPVRKWKKQWVHVSPSSSSNFSYRNNTYSSSSRSHNNGNNKASALLLCRWTPISPSASADRNSPEEPPTRKFRYTPIVVLEQKKEAAEKIDDKHKTSSVHLFTIETTRESDDAYEKPKAEGALIEEIQATNKNLLNRQHTNVSYLDLDLGLKGHDENL